jgi:hypothetical protein
MAEANKCGIRVLVPWNRLARVGTNGGQGSCPITGLIQHEVCDQSAATGAPPPLTARRASQMTPIIAMLSQPEIQNRSSDASR